MHARHAMRTRRAFLATGLGLLIFSAGHRARAVGVEAEGAVYGGQTSGGWICGPVGTAHYGGVGTELTVTQRERSPNEGRGLVGDVAVGGESTTVTPLSCSSQTCTSVTPDQLPPKLMLGGRVRGGYEWRYVGFEVGLGVFQGWGITLEPNSMPPLFNQATDFYPDLSISFGKLHYLYGVLGYGSPLVTQLLRPGLYGGFGIASASGFGADLHAGYFRQGPGMFDSGGPRADLVGRAPIPGTQNLYLRLGGSVGSPTPNTAPLDWEGSLGLSAGY
jgi:hypothetical protein